jgi:hypothetical protein
MTTAVRVCATVAAALFLGLIVDVDSQVGPMVVGLTVLVVVASLLLVPGGRALLPATVVFTLVGASRLFYDFALWRYLGGSAPFESGLPVYAEFAAVALVAVTMAIAASRVERTAFRVPVGILSLLASSGLVLACGYMWVGLSIP